MTCSVRARALIATLLLATGACASDPPEDPRLRDPALVASADALAPFLERARRLVGTPAARIAGELEREVADCKLIRARFLPDDEARGGFRPEWSCLDQPTDARETDFKQFALANRADHDAILFWPIGEDGRTTIRFDLADDGSVEATGAFFAPSRLGLLRLLIPSSDPPAPAVLNASNTLIQGRARPRDGLGLAELMQSGGQADRMFALKGKLFENALLAGTWEANLLPPAIGGRLPLPAIALHHRGTAPAQAALDEALSQLESMWPIQRTPRSFASASAGTIEGGCFLELPLLPELAPCWVVHPDAFVIAWRAEALDAVLGAPAVSAKPHATPHTPAQLEIRLDEFARVDTAIQGSARPIGLGDLFSNLSLTVEPEAEGQVVYRISLVSRG